MNAAHSTRDEVIQKLRHHQGGLMQMGVKHAALFGSVARGTDGRNSDIDIIIDIDDQQLCGLATLGRIQQMLSKWLERPVDIATRTSLRPSVAREFRRDAINVF
ncbi:nucleotidyltransferase family protein [Phreatobacter oligotrophus]|uniref:nucleotidyltransferase family protein n=1 Tax=Phreatobacter oligotrophus TaxID=1122261 RepID=UPI0011B248FD|nr:nucleotidyltransferase domain-containing protein [Phreatobacter oligotrophus]